MAVRGPGEGSGRGRTLAARHVAAGDLDRAGRRAWGLIEQGLVTGRMVRDNGEVLELTPGQYLELVKWAAGYVQPGKTRGALGVALVGPSAGAAGGA